MWNPLIFLPFVGSHNMAARPSPSAKSVLSTGPCLNETLQGSLLSVRPTAAPCHDPEFSTEACSIANQSWSDPFWRSSQPGGYMSGFWGSPNCLTHPPRSQSCDKARVPLLAADVRSEDDIVQVINFVKDKKVKIRVKNTGHDM